MGSDERATTEALRMRRACLLVLLASVMASASLAATLSLDFADQPNRVCGDTWSMSGVGLRLLPLSSGAGSASHTDFGWILGTACLELDVSSLAGISSVTVSFLNYDAQRGFAIYLLDAVAPVGSALSFATRVDQELRVPAGEGGVERVRIFCYNCILRTLEIRYDTVATVGEGWGSLKARYR